MPKQIIGKREEKLHRKVQRDEEMRRITDPGHRRHRKMHLKFRRAVESALDVLNADESDSRRLWDAAWAAWDEKNLKARLERTPKVEE